MNSPRTHRERGSHARHHSSASDSSGRERSAHSRSTHHQQQDHYGRHHHHHHHHHQSQFHHHIQQRSQSYESSSIHDSSDDYDSDNECPLCMEEFDATDKQFRPCKCGYQVCIWCWHRINETADGKGRCPNCRRYYEQKNFEFSKPDQKTLENEISRQTKRTRRSATRRQLSNVRVIQRNLVYAVGLTLNYAKEEFLRRDDAFGAYGRIIKIAINKNNIHMRHPSDSSGDERPQTVSAYITYARTEDAYRAIQAIDGTWLDGRQIRASYGTTKYCAFFLRGVTCNNPDCMYLHEYANEEDTFNKEDIVLKNGVPVPHNMEKLQHLYPRPSGDVVKHVWRTGKGKDSRAPTSAATVHRGDLSTGAKDDGAVIIIPSKGAAPVSQKPGLPSSAKWGKVSESALSTSPSSPSPLDNAHFPDLKGPSASTNAWEQLDTSLERPRSESSKNKNGGRGGGKGGGICGVAPGNTQRSTITLTLADIVSGGGVHSAQLKKKAQKSTLQEKRQQTQQQQHQQVQSGRVVKDDKAKLLDKSAGEAVPTGTSTTTTTTSAITTTTTTTTTTTVTNDAGDNSGTMTPSTPAFIGSDSNQESDIKQIDTATTDGHPRWYYPQTQVQQPQSQEQHPTGIDLSSPDSILASLMGLNVTDAQSRRSKSSVGRFASDQDPILQSPSQGRSRFLEASAISKLTPVPAPTPVDPASPSIAPARTPHQKQQVSKFGVPLEQPSSSTSSTIDLQQAFRALLPNVNISFSTWDSSSSSVPSHTDSPSSTTPQGSNGSPNISGGSETIGMAGRWINDADSAAHGHDHSGFEPHRYHQHQQQQQQQQHYNRHHNHSFYSHSQPQLQPHPQQLHSQQHPFPYHQYQQHPQQPHQNFLHRPYPQQPFHQNGLWNSSNINISNNININISAASRSNLDHTGVPPSGSDWDRLVSNGKDVAK